MTTGTDTTIHSGGGYTFGTVNLDTVFSDSGLSSSANIGSGTGGAVDVIISPKEGHGNSAITELGGHFVMNAITLSQAEGDDVTTENDFRQVGLVVDPTHLELLLLQLHQLQDRLMLSKVLQQLEHLKQMR